VTETRLTPDRYLELIAADAARLSAVAAGRLDAPVPTCPGWNLTDLVAHTGEVYHHKVACTVLGRRPEQDEYEHGPADGQDPLEWFGSATTTLLETLRGRAPESYSATWYEPDQTVGFWQRRMAQETVVHRVDAEAAGDQITASADDLAVDGIDEVLDLFLRYSLGEDPDEDLVADDGRSLLVRTGPWAWHVSVDGTDRGHKIRLVRSGGAAEATVSGEPSELLLWLWGRRPDSAVTVHGDPAAVDAWRALLVRATQ
jgi:uncharacterized protein (TIGR03083 family)